MAVPRNRHGPADTTDPGRPADSGHDTPSGVVEPITPIRDDESHADWFDGQLDAIDRVGIQQYLDQHVAAGEGGGE